MSARNNILENQNLSVISRVFSSSLYRELAKKACSPQFARIARETTNLGILDSSISVADYFNMAFELLRSKDYRHEYPRLNP